MGIDDAQESRLISRGMPGDDPTWGEVSAFLETVDSAYADIRTTDLAAGHLAAVSREVRLVRGELQHGRKKTMKDLFTLKTHRILAGSVAAAVIALTAGVGVASAMPGGPLAHLIPASPVELTPTPAPVTPSETPVASAHESESSDDDADEPEATSTTTPAPKPSARHTDNESDDDSSDDSQARDGSKKESHANPSDSGDDSEEADDSGDSGDDENASSEHRSGGSDDNESGDDNGSHDGDGSTDD